ncbi:TPA: hypothetical protein R1887_005206 [Klebsiella oxytoca]|nr:hypothetical protein [Klebsiella michiganensis]HEC2122608.1 hypothetical protein [Klebsiella oxytoca]
MKLKKIVVLLLLYPVVVFGVDNHSVILEVKGVAYKSCTIEGDSTLNIGEHRANDWVVGANYLDPQEGRSYQTATIRLGNCDANTKVRISASGTASNSNVYYMKNTKAQQDIMGTLQVQKPSDQSWVSMAMDKSNYVDVTTASNATDTLEIKIRATLRRNDINNSPIGKFEATPMLIFTFL